MASFDRRQRHELPAARAAPLAARDAAALILRFVFSATPTMWSERVCNSGMKSSSRVGPAGTVTDKFKS